MPKSKKTTAKASRQTKDKVLQARIPDNLDEELRDRARDLGLSVSTVVRNVLSNTFNLVEGVVTDSSQIARVFNGTDQNPASPDSSGKGDGHPEPVGWQELTLNRNGICEGCNAILTKGTDACVGIPVQSRAVFLCLECLSALKANDTGE